MKPALHSILTAVVLFGVVLATNTQPGAPLEAADATLAKLNDVLKTEPAGAQ